MTQTVGTEIATLRAAMSGTVLVAGRRRVRRRASALERRARRRPAVIAQCESAADVVRRRHLRSEQRAGDRRTRRGAQRPGQGDGRRRPGDRPERAERGRGRPGGPARARRRRRAARRPRSRPRSSTASRYPVGVVSHTGVGGLTLGGGMGWLTRKHGLTHRQPGLRRGRHRRRADPSRAADDENADLFWALRGGGGNFGVVTEFEFELHPVGPMVQFGLLFWSLEQGRDVLRLAREIFATLPRRGQHHRRQHHAPPAPFVPSEHHFTPGYGAIVVGFGRASEYDEAVERMRERRCRRCSSSRRRCLTSRCSRCSTKPTPGASTATTRAATSRTSPTTSSMSSPSTPRARRHRCRSRCSTAWTAPTAPSARTTPPSAAVALPVQPLHDRGRADAGAARRRPRMGAAT